jgi:phosphoglucomutase
MESLRQNPPTEIAGEKVTIASDYKLSVEKNLADNTESEIKLPKSNVLAFKLENGGSFIIRPSGTEPKIKVYTAAVGTLESAEAKLDEFEKAANTIMGK